MSELEEHIRREIAGRGPISFCRFMELALYHPRWGYYLRSQDPFGRSGDFFTSSQLQPVFGRLIAQQIGRWRTELGNPRNFVVVDMGAGRGETLAEVRRCLPRVECLAVERSAGELPGSFSGVVYANEFIDALPVHVVESRGGRLIEWFVKATESGFGWVEQEATDPKLAGFVERYAAGLGEGQRIEVNLAALDELEQISRSLERGYLLVIDYGYTAEEIVAGKRLPQGSLLGYERHQPTNDVLGHPGGRDITAHVNFTALEHKARELGLASLGLKSQAQFLMGIGEPDEFREVLQAPTEREALQLRMQLKTLLFGMGETFRVLVLRK